jgi:hypothetical protein
MKKAAIDASAKQAITMSTLHAIVCSPPHLSRLLTAHFDANYCNIHTIAIGYVPKLQRNLIGLNYNYRNYAALYSSGQLLSATIRKSQHTHTSMKAVK